MFRGSAYPSKGLSGFAHLQIDVAGFRNRMLRVSLAMYLALSTAAGPMLCCCMTLRWVCATSKASKEPPCDAPSCCCCEQSKPLRPVESFPTDSTLAAVDGSERLPLSHRCPCRQNGFARGAALPASRSVTPHGDDALFNDWVSSPTEAPTLTGVRLVSKPSPAIDSCGAPFMTTARLLYAHHLLRC
jgi:hypothetical protein